MKKAILAALVIAMAASTASAKQKKENLVALNGWPDQYVKAGKLRLGNNTGNDFPLLPFEFFVDTEVLKKFKSKHEARALIYWPGGNGGCVLSCGTKVPEISLEFAQDICHTVGKADLDAIEKRMNLVLYTLADDAADCKAKRSYRRRDYSISEGAQKRYNKIGRVLRLRLRPEIDFEAMLARNCKGRR